MNKKHLKVLREIQEGIPPDLMSQLTRKEKQFTTLTEVLTRALKEPDSVVSAKDKSRYKNILDSGILNKEVEVINTPIELQIGAYIDAELAKAVKDGRLPKKAPKMKLLHNKGKQYARRQHERLKKLFHTGEGGEGADSKDDSGNPEARSPREDAHSVLPRPSEESQDA